MEIEIDFSDLRNKIKLMWMRTVWWWYDLHPIFKSIIAAAILVKAIFLVIFIIWLIGQGPMWLKIGAVGLVVFSFIVLFLYCEIFE